MENKLEKFASILRKLRKEKDLTQKAAASELKISTNYYSELERGDKLPSVDLLYTIAKYYSINVIVFFEEKDATKDSFKENNSESGNNGEGSPYGSANNQKLEKYYRELLSLKDEIIASKDDNIESKNQLISELRNELKMKKE